MKHKKKREQSYEERLDDYLLRNIFAKKPNAAPKHPILSSPFARRISESAFGPKKPKWYKRLTSSQHRLFKEILHHVEVAMGGYFKFSDFLDVLQRFDPTITRSEVTDIFYDMEIEEEDVGDLDFGRFLFLLAYKDQVAENDAADNSDGKTTPRQRLILSAIAYFVLNTNLADIEEYYSRNRRQKSEVLHQHLEAMRLAGLSEREMEAKQKDINKKLSRLYSLTGSPYAQPLPVVRSIRKNICGRPKRITALKSDAGKIDDMNLKLDSEEEKLIKEINDGKIPLPKICFPTEMQRQLRTGEYTIEMQDYMMQKAEEAKQSLRDRMKEAKIVYAKKHLRSILLDGFSSEEEMDSFIKIYQRYFPLESSDAKNSST